MIFNRTKAIKLLFIYLLINIYGCGTTLIPKKGHEEVDESIKLKIQQSEMNNEKIRYVICGGEEIKKRLYKDKKTGVTREVPEYIDLLKWLPLNYGPLKISLGKFGNYEINLDESLVIDSSEVVNIKITTDWAKKDYAIAPFSFITPKNAEKKYFLKVNLISVMSEDIGSITISNMQLPAAGFDTRRLASSENYFNELNCQNKKIIAYIDR